MKYLGIYAIGVCILMTVSGPLRAQIDTTQSVDFLVKKILLGSGVLVGNVTFTGEKHAIGLYTDSTNQLGIQKGIVLTSGNAFYVQGPNKTPRAGWASNAKGDDELDQIARGKTFDASILEFDFITVSEYLSFEFVFASEEYLEYVGSKFNDVFAFFITTPDGRKYNIAKLPDGVTPITVNTVNNELNDQYYIDNAYTNTTDPFVWDVRNRKVVDNDNYLKEAIPPKYFTQFDGFTTVLKASTFVEPNRKYHIKIALADVGDGILDSGVFLKAGSFNSSGDQVVEVEDIFHEDTPVVELARKTTIPNLTSSSPKRELKHNVTIGNVEFEFDQYDLTPNSTAVINNVYQQWSFNPEGIIYLRGHTDSRGSDEYNIILSMKRANMVAHALANMGVPTDKIKVDYFGERKPIRSNANDFGRARNRRVEFSLIF